MEHGNTENTSKQLRVEIAPPLILRSDLKLESSQLRIDNHHLLGVNEQRYPDLWLQIVLFFSSCKDLSSNYLLLCIESISPDYRANLPAVAGPPCFWKTTKLLVKTLLQMSAIYNNIMEKSFI